MRSAAAAYAGQDDEFVDDPVFEEILCADGSGSNVGALGRGNPGWSSSQCTSLLSSIYFDCCLQSLPCSGRLRGVGRGGGQVGGRGRTEDDADDQGEGRGGQRGRTGARGRGRAGGRRGQGGEKSRSFSFTINNYKSVPTGLHPKMKYLCFGKEVGKENGTPHLQGYVVFKNAHRKPHQYFLEHGHGHFEITRGTPKQNIDYCSKDGDFTEFGTRPMERREAGRRGGEMEIERWEEAWTAAKEGRIEDIPADIRLRHYGTILKVTSRYQQPPEELDSLDNLWIVGEHGTGKSTWVHRTHPGAYKKGFNKWWDGFREDEPGHKTVLLDDLHPKFTEKEMLKNWADVFPFQAEIKGGSMTIRPERIIVTSNYHPSEVFGEKDLGPIMRRFKVTTVADLPPAPPKRRRADAATEEAVAVTGAGEGMQAGAEIVGENVNLEDVDESEFAPQIQAVLDQGIEGGQGADGEQPGQQSRGQDGVPIDSEDGELELGVQQVLEIQLQAGQGKDQLNTQEFEARFFNNV